MWTRSTRTAPKPNNASLKARSLILLFFHPRACLIFPSRLTFWQPETLTQTGTGMQSRRRVESKTLYLFSGDGHGNFGTAKQIDLPGRATAITSGDINRADGLTDLVVAVAGDDGPKVLVFEGPEGALKSNPEIFSLPAEAASLVIGRFDEDVFADFVAAAGQRISRSARAGSQVVA